MTVGAVLGVFILAIAGLVVYAILNLDSIIAANRAYLLARATDAVGRPLEAQDLKASVGWGIKMDMTGVRVADDPAFSQRPFLQARDIVISVEFIPLLARSLRVTSIVIEQPQLRVIRNQAGVFNFSTLAQGRRGGGPGSPATKATNRGAGGFAALTVSRLQIKDGVVAYLDQQAGGSPANINAFNLDLENFTATSPFDIDLALAAFGNQKNFSLRGKAGPLVQHGELNLDTAPLDLVARVGPVSIDQIRAMPQLAQSLPPDLSISEPLIIDSRIKGTIESATVVGSSDLTSSHVVYGRLLDKPALLPMRLGGALSRANGRLQFRLINLTLADLKARLTNVTFDQRELSAKIDTNKFDLAGLGAALIPARSYQPGGKVEIHSSVRIVDRQPTANGVLSLTNVRVTVAGAKIPSIDDLSGTLRMAGNSAHGGPMTFKLGTARATFETDASSLQPLRAAYHLTADSLNIGEVVPSRAALGEHLSQFQASGNLSRGADTIIVGSDVSSASGMVANVTYQNLAAASVYDGDRITINSLKLGAFDGAVAGSGAAALSGGRAFSLKLTADNIDVQKALESQKARASRTIRGRLTGIMQVAGAGANLDQVKPTLRGSGNALLNGGKLVGVNIVSQALGKIDNLPGIGSLVPAAIVSGHPALFRSNDTDIQQAHLTFAIQGPRLITHDLTLEAADYLILGDGWFDMNQNVDMNAKLLMSKNFSAQLVSMKRNTVYLEDPEGRIEIPLRIAGQLPKPAILPDVTILAQRAAAHAVQNQLGGLIEKKTGKLGGFLGGTLPGAGHGSNSQPAPSNPLNQLKGLFH